MDGSLTDLGGGKYRCRISFVNDLGKRIQKSKTFTASGKKEARNIMRKFRSECIKNTAPQELVTLQDLYNSFVEYHGRDVQPATMVFYSNVWRHLKEYYNTKLSTIKPNIVRAMLDTVPANSRIQKGVYQLLSAMFNYALHADLLTYNPCINVKSPQYKAPEKKTLSMAQKELLNKAVSVYPMKYQVIYNLTLTLGFRREEVCALKWSDIDFENKLLHINRTAMLVKGKGTIIKNSAKTERSKSSLPLTDKHIKILNDYKDYSNLEKKTYGIKTDFLFYQRNGDVISLSSVSHWFSKLCKNLNLDGITFHSLRHTFATNYIYDGGDIAVLRVILGHTDIKTTQIYLHLAEMKKIFSSRFNSHIDKLKQNE